MASPVRIARGLSPRGRRLIGGMLLGGMALGTLGGCAGQMTRRDEYYLIHGLTFQPEAGDGTTISVGREREVLRDIANAGQGRMRGIELER